MIPVFACRWLMRRLKPVSERAPDLTIVNGINGAAGIRLHRWWVIPRNRWLNVYLHHWLLSDDQHAEHDHPWASCSILLEGDYVEVTRGKGHYRSEGSVIFRRARTPHRVLLMGDPLARYGDLRQVWSLFITGPRVRNWGWHCRSGWLPHQFLEETRAGKSARVQDCP